MAEDKKSFLLYVDMRHFFSTLSDEHAGQLIKHTFAYVNDENPEPPNVIVSALFEPIKQKLKSDLIKYNKSKEVSRENGKLGGRPKKSEERPISPPPIEKPVAPAKAPREIFKQPTVDQVREYCLERKNTVDPERFVDHYKSNGWMVGRTKMKDWQATIRNSWEKNSFGAPPRPAASTVKTTHANSGDGTDWAAEAAKHHGQ